MTDLQAAEARIRETRAQLFATLGEVQQRLRPASLAQDAVESAAQSVASVAKQGTRAVKRHPVATAALAGTVGLVMARGWIADILGARKQPADETPAADAGLNVKRTRASRAKEGPGK